MPTKFDGLDWLEARKYTLSNKKSYSNRFTNYCETEINT